jgi:hypothetical protein
MWHQEPTQGLLELSEAEDTRVTGYLLFRFGESGHEPHPSPR